jgi:hypothetical protein
MDTFPVALNFVTLTAIVVWMIWGFLQTMKHR